MKEKSLVFGTWTNSTFRAYVTVLVGAMSWRVALAVGLLLCRSVSQGAQLLMLVPLMQLVGLDVQQGSMGWLAGFVESAFAAVGLTPTVPAVLGAFVLFSVVLALLTRWQTTSNYKLQQDFKAFLRRRLYRAIVGADWLTLSRSRSSDFTHALTTEVTRVGGATASLLHLITDAVLVSVYVLFALQLSLAMSAMALVCGAGLALLLRKKTQAARTLGRAVSRTTSDLYSAASEHLGGIKTVKSYGAEERSTDIFSRLIESVAKAHTDGNRNYADTAFWFGVGSVVILSVVLYVSLVVLALPAAGLILLLFLFNRMIPLFNNIQRSYHQYLNALPAFAEVMEIQARCEAAAEPKAPRSKAFELQQGLRFENVSFAYDTAETPAVRELDLLIPAGETTAIVGPSGAGKSTMADLVMGLISPSQGEMLVDGTPLDAERMRSWREQIGYVAQDNFLFNDTVRANLLWARPNADDEAIDRALRLAVAEGFVSRLPNGVETVLGDRGVRLSGGERQRLALARALLREPALLILDEATSALDSENEKRIQRAIEGLHGHTTILVITHRLSTIRRADTIHVLEHGRLVESGDWNTLIDKESGRFAALAQAQGMVAPGSGE